MESAWIGLGSNLDDRLGLMEQALEHLAADGAISLRSVSSAWETSPVGPVKQGAYLNAVAWLRTSLPPGELLGRLLSVEEALGRVRKQRWGPRRIDLDLLLYSDRQIDEEGLRVPHPYLEQRRFVLSPLLELAPGTRHPVSGQRLIHALRALPVDAEHVVPRALLRLP